MSVKKTLNLKDLELQLDSKMIPIGLQKIMEMKKVQLNVRSVKNKDYGMASFHTAYPNLEFSNYPLVNPKAHE